MLLPSYLELRNAITIYCISHFENPSPITGPRLTNQSRQVCLFMMLQVVRVVLNGNRVHQIVKPWHNIYFCHVQNHPEVFLDINATYTTTCTSKKTTVINCIMSVCRRKIKVCRSNLELDRGTHFKSGRLSNRLLPNANANETQQRKLVGSKQGPC